MNPMRDGIARAALGTTQAAVDGELGQRFRFPADFVGFAGHFPDFPILPGVVQLLLAQWLIETGTGQGRVLREVANAKFLEQLLPGGEIAVHCRPRGAADAGWWAVRIEVDGRPAATFQLRLETTA
jgi:3-hydroxyacyl-[acyl-carrier-protein] dehydratase